MLLVGIDTGGTFTDFILQSEGKWNVYKAPSTPENPAKAVLDGIAHIAKSQKVHLIHGSTVATNAILEGNGAVTALITNRGFEDIIEIARQNRENLYDLAYHKTKSIVPRYLRFGINCRMNSEGAIVADLDEKDVRRVRKLVDEYGAESLAVCFLFSFLNPDHENRVKGAFDALNIPVSLSHEIMPEFREYERTSTTILNAYVMPKMQSYIGGVADSVGKKNIRIMQSNGGSIKAETAMRESVRTLLSGPAGGVVGAFEIGKVAGYEKLITFDMGGTSTDVALVDVALPITASGCIGSHPVNVPMIDIHTVGAGGGSIADIDTGGSLRVGPASAGADPGPICYGKGDQITVTDANLFLGRIIPETFLGGNMALYPQRLAAAFDRLGKTAGLPPSALAEGILSVANTTMERAIRVTSVEKGFDPREFTLFAFGGAGGMHAAILAGLLDIPRVLIPKHPGLLSAIGMMLSDVVKDYSLTVMADANWKNQEAVAAFFQPLETKGLADLENEGFSPDNVIVDKYLDMRYQGQSYEITVPYGSDYIDRFHRIHEQMYGYSDGNKAVQIATIRIRARGVPDKPAMPMHEKGGKKPPSKASRSIADVVFDGSTFPTTVLERDKLLSGNVIEGPAIVVEYSSTIVVPPHTVGTVDDFGNILIHIL